MSENQSEEEVQLAEGETMEEAVVTHEIEDRPDPDALAGDEIDDEEEE